MIGKKLEGKLKRVEGEGRSIATDRVSFDLIDAKNKGSLSLPSLLELSAAFDAVDHDILQIPLTTSFGISGRSIQWFISYLTDRTIPRKLNTGVP